MTLARSPKICTRRLVLRPYVTADHDAWLEGFTSRAPPQHEYDGGPLDPRTMSRSSFRALCAKHRRLRRRDEVHVLGVFDRRTGRHVGHVDIGIVERGATQRANLGYAVHNTFQRQGFATEACIAAIAYAFRELKLHRIEAVIDPDNVPSIRLARRIGMQRVGLVRSFWFQHGAWADQVVWVAVDGIWRGSRAR